MHDLDTRNKDILVDIDSASDDYLRKVRDLSPAKRKGEMAKFQSEMKEKGRLSQSETEEEEEIPVKQKTKAKKKGNLKEEGKKKKKQKNEPQTTPSHPYPNLPVPQEVLDMPVDPNEPAYCLCQQVSYGEMIGCDNPDCPIEWFHFGCLNISTKPKGKWYCPKCASSFKKKR